MAANELRLTKRSDKPTKKVLRLLDEREGLRLLQEDLETGEVPGTLPAFPTPRGGVPTPEPTRTPDPFDPVPTSDPQPARPPRASQRGDLGPVERIGRTIQEEAEPFIELGRESVRALRQGITDPEGAAAEAQERQRRFKDDPLSVALEALEGPGDTQPGESLTFEIFDVLAGGGIRAGIRTGVRKLGAQTARAAAEDVSEDALIRFGGGVTNEDNLLRQIRIFAAAEATTPAQQASKEQLVAQATERLNEARQAAIARGRATMRSMRPAEPAPGTGAPGPRTRRGRPAQEGAPTPAAGAAAPPSEPPLDRVTRMWKEPPKGPTTPLPQKLTDVRLAAEERLTDRFAFAAASTRRARNAWEKTNPGRKFPHGLNAELHLNLLPGVPEFAFQQALDVLGNVRKVMGKLDLDHANTVLMLRHLRDVQAMRPTRKMPAGLQSVDEIQDALTDLQNRLPADDWRRVNRAAAIVRDHYRDLLNLKVEEGLITPEFAKVLTERYPWFNPTKYIEGKLTQQIEQGGAGISINQSGLRQLSEDGAELAREAPLDVLQRATMQAQLLLAKNRTSKVFINTLLHDPTLVGQVRKVTTTRPVAQVGEETIMRPARGDIPGTLSYMENGVRQTYEVPDWAERIAKNMTFIPPSEFEIAGRVINAIPRGLLTTMSPGFIPANFIFDTAVVAMRNHILPHEVGLAFLKNLRAIIREDKVYHDMIRRGVGGTGWWADLPEEFVRKVQKSGNIVIRDKAMWRRIFESPYTTIKTIGRMTEMAPRRAVFEKELKRGADVLDATLEARRATVDFQRAGTAVRKANAWFLYLNAGVQGFALPFRAFRDNPRFRVGLAGFMAGQLPLYLWNRQFPEYQDIPTRDRYGKGVIMLPSNEFDKRGNKVPHYIVVPPMLREFAAFSAPLQYLFAKLDETDTATFNEVAKSVGHEVNPVSAFLGEGGFGVPTFIGERLTEIVRNHDTFRDRPIIPFEFEDLPVEEQFDERTTLTARRLGEWFNISPFNIDHLMNVGAARDIFAATDAIVRHTSEGVDPRIDSFAAQLEDITEHAAPDDVERLRRAFLNSLSKEDREAALAAERTPDPRLPAATSIIERFYRKQGGQLFRSGQAAAAKEAGVSVKQTREASRQLSARYEDLFAQEQALDEMLWSGEITPFQWRKGHATIGAEYGGALNHVAIVFPKAAQGLPPHDFATFQRNLHTLLGRMPDRRTKGQLLVAAYRTIQPKETIPGSFDWRDFYNRRDAFVAGLSKADRKVFEAEREAGMTLAEKQWDFANEVLRPYWEAHHTLYANHPQLANLIDAHSSASPKDQRDLEAAAPFLRPAINHRDRFRLALRVAKPEIEFFLQQYYERVPLAPEEVLNRARPAVIRGLEAMGLQVPQQPSPGIRIPGVGGQQTPAPSGGIRIPGLEQQARPSAPRGRIPGVTR